MKIKSRQAVFLLLLWLPIGALGAWFVFKGQYSHRRNKEAAAVSTLGKWLSAYRLDHGRFPETLNVLWNKDSGDKYGADPSLLANVEFLEYLGARPDLKDNDPILIAHPRNNRGIKIVLRAGGSCYATKVE